jgi:hypothetical protein
MNITGNFRVDRVGGQSTESIGGAFSVSSVTQNINNQSGSLGKDLYFNFDASRSWTGTTNTVANHTHSISATSGGAGSHSHTITVANNGSHTHTTNNTGSGTPLNIMPPYMTVYMWRRTA